MINLNQPSKEPKRPLRKFTAIVAAALMLAVSVLAVGVVSVPVSAASVTNEEVDVQLVPHYSYVDYRMDRIETLQRFDSMGDLWTAVSTPTVTDSTLVMGQNMGANVSVASWPHIDDGTYYEIKMKAASVDANVSLSLVGSATNYMKLVLGATGKITCIYTNATAFVLTYQLMAVYVANTYYKLSLEFQDSQVVATACYENGTVILSHAITDGSLDYDEITDILIKQTVAAKIGTCDWFVQTATATSFTPETATGADLRTDPNAREDYLKMRVDFGKADMTPGTYSNDPTVHTAFGSTVTTLPVSTDRYYNLTDFAGVLGSTKEDKEPVTGIAKLRGWNNLHDDNELTLQEFLAKKHAVGVEDISVIDYYINDLKINYTWSAGLQEKVKDTWYNSMKSAVKDIGGELTFSKDRTIEHPLHSYADVKYAYFPSQVTQKQVDSMMKTVSNDMRDKTIACALLAPCAQSDLVDPAMFNLAIGAYELALDPTKTVGENWDTSYQFTDAMVGEMLSDSDSMGVDAQAVQANQNWTVVADGKPVPTAATSMVVFGSDLWLIIIIIVVMIIATVVLSIFVVRKHKKKRKG
jgi:hypothetical protein